MAVDRRVLLPALASLTVMTLSAQSPKPSFEVASIKRNTSGEPGRGGDSTIISGRPGLFTATNVTLERLILSAYVSPHGGAYIPERLVGGPSWVRTRRFDVQAKGPEELLATQRSKMIQSLLEDRFGLVVGEGEIETDVYVLRPARADRQPGPLLIPRTASECASRPLSKLEQALQRLQAGPDGKPLPPAPDVPPSPNAIPAFTPAPRPTGANSTFSGCTTIASITRSISRILNRDVDDRTGMDGKWDFTLYWASMAGGRSGDVDVPDIFGAVQEQLGLKLERTRGPADVLVIDSVHEPTEN